MEKLSNTLEININNQQLIQVSSYILGEISLNNVNVIQSMERIMILPQTTTETLLYIIIALSKIGSRLGMNQEISNFLQKFTISNDLEVQQRSGEMVKLLTTDICSYVLAPNTDDSQNYSEEKSAKIIQVNNEKEELDDDLLSIVLDDKTNKQSTQSYTNYLDSLLGYQIDEKPVHKITPPPNSTELYNNNEIIIFTQTQSNPKDPNQIAKRLLIHNKSTTPITRFMIIHQTPPGYLLIEKPDMKLDGTTLSTDSPLEQILYIKKATSQPFEMKTSIKYDINSQTLSVSFISN